MSAQQAQGTREGRPAPSPAATTRGRRFPAETLSRAEVAALLNACSRRAPTGVRNRALLVLLYRGGLRIAEALALRPADVDPEAGTVTIMRGKGHKRRVVGLDDGSMADVLRWLDLRGARGINGHRPLICTLRGGPVSGQYVRAMLARLARKAGIERRVNPHALRHTYAAELAREGVPITIIQAALGHGSLTTTERYVRHLQPMEVIDRLRERPPLAA